MAKLATNRMASATDTDFRNIMKVIFKIKPTDTDFIANSTEIQQRFYQIQILTETNDHKASDIRFYCDEDQFFDPKSPKVNEGARWQRLSDRMWDKENMIVGSLTTFGCSYTDENGDRKGGATYTTKDTRDKTQNPNRITITMCKYALDGGVAPLPSEPRKFPVVYQTELSTRNWAIGYSIQNFAVFLPATIVHELIHAVSYGYVLDVPVGNCYGWKNVRKASKEDAMRNADSHAMLAVWALVANWGWTLIRPNPPARYSSSEKKDYMKCLDERVKSGQMRKYSNPPITSRNLRSLGKLEKDGRTDVSKRVREFLEGDEKLLDSLMFSTLSETGGYEYTTSY
ncbi:hypothetical protein BDV96DRAFT_686772 [Lophiotrema nucula]|uniref:Lysine-specific metallo-endopeptidase domain-containing protein n=1 Tax=Lophiotrema nucula TaxID=690887 RepID=A0A6A5ZCD0_9PLEO|nr:hypothetical protein BDV96DRAFT_686772 [Lophiotrema nucula]